MTNTPTPPAPIGSGRVCVMRAFYQSRTAKSIHRLHQPGNLSSGADAPKLSPDINFHPAPNGTASKPCLSSGATLIPTAARRLRAQGRVSATS